MSSWVSQYICIQAFALHTQERCLAYFAAVLQRAYSECSAYRLMQNVLIDVEPIGLSGSWGRVVDGGVQMTIIRNWYEYVYLGNGNITEFPALLQISIDLSTCVFYIYIKYLYIYILNLNLFGSGVVQSHHIKQYWCVVNTL